MKLDGRTFKKSNSVVPLPFDGHFYTKFGKVCHPDTKGAVKTRVEWKVAPKWASDGDPIYALPIKMSGHSLADMAYGEKYKVKTPWGYVTKMRAFVLKNGCTYTTSFEV